MVVYRARFCKGGTGDNKTYSAIKKVSKTKIKARGFRQGALPFGVCHPFFFLDGNVLNLGCLGRRGSSKHRESLGQRSRAGRTPDVFRGW